jgi:hypothetical protein
LFILCACRHKAIADYLSANGFHSALEHFQKEADLSGQVEQRYIGLLEKKWTSVIRLQKRVSHIGPPRNTCMLVNFLMRMLDENTLVL